jgi:peroxiredoxin
MKNEVPLTLEGSSVLHQMFRIRWQAWKSLTEERRAAAVEEAIHTFAGMEQEQTALFSLLGHKGDLMLVHFRSSFEELNQAELCLAQLEISEFLEPTSSYLSVVELGLYESTVRLNTTLAEKNIAPGSPEWDQEIEQVLEVQRKAMKPRLFPPIPPNRYCCFYPMDKRRGESKNWYSLEIGERQRMMHEHMLIGRRYAGTVKQIISGSIGFDDWEWGVDLFADDPLVFKRLIYEMRFDEVSAAYALFGTFYLGLRFNAADLGVLLRGTTPKLEPPE